MLDARQHRHIRRGRPWFVGVAWHFAARTHVIRVRLGDVPVWQLGKTRASLAAPIWAWVAGPAGQAAEFTVKTLAKSRRRVYGKDKAGKLAKCGSCPVKTTY
jgi:hypothetical protein